MPARQICRGRVRSSCAAAAALIDKEGGGEQVVALAAAVRLAVGQCGALLAPALLLQKMESGAQISMLRCFGGWSKGELVLLCFALA